MATKWVKEYCRDSTDGEGSNILALQISRRIKRLIRQYCLKNQIEPDIMN